MNKFEEWKSIQLQAASACEAIFDDYHEGEVGSLTRSTSDAWRIGKSVSEFKAKQNEVSRRPKDTNSAEN